MGPFNRCCYSFVPVFPAPRLRLLRRRLSSPLFGSHLVASLLVASLLVASLLGGSILSVAHPAYADIVDGAPAVDLIGQYDQTSLIDPVPDYDKSGLNDTPNRYGFNQPQGIALDVADHRLFVADSLNGRVLVFNLDISNRLVDLFPDHVLGQPDFRTTLSETTATVTKQPRGLAYDGERKLLFVADSPNRRVVVFDVAAITDGEAAIAVLGQPSLTDQVGGPVSDSLLSSPVGLAYDSVTRRLFVSDSLHRRVMVFDLIEITNGEAAVNVLGQTDFTTTTSAATQGKFIEPAGLALDGLHDRLFVADRGGHRVLAFDVSTITNGQSAVNVICQANFTNTTVAAIATRCNQPIGLWYDGPRQRLYVSERGNSRVHYFALGASFSNGLSATGVIGQAALGSGSSPATTRAGLAAPDAVVANPFDGRLYVTDTGNSRVLVFDAATITDGEEAEALSGQYDETSYTDPVPLFTKGGAGNSPNRFGLAEPGHLALDRVRHRLFITDTINQRVLVHQLDTSDRLIDYLPDAVIGQADFATVLFETSATSISAPTGIAYDPQGDRLFVSDSSSHRILVYSTSTITSGEAAVAVLGQADFTSNVPGSTQATLSSPQGLAFDETTRLLFVADRLNHRIVAFDVASITNGESAVKVLGQPDFTSSGAGTSATSLQGPQGLAVDSGGRRLFVTDSNSNRVLVFDIATITNGEAAVKVLCQTTLTGDDSNLTRSGCSFPTAIAFDAENNHLQVADAFNGRVLTFDTAAIANGEDAVHVLGQPDFTSSDPNPSITRTGRPEGLVVDSVNDRLYVSDGGRVIAFPTAYSATYSGRTFVEATSGNGAVNTAITLTLRNEFFAVESGVLTRGAHYSIGTLPAGLTEVVTVTSPTTARITLSGSATRNDTADSVTGIAFTLLDAGVRNMAVANIDGASTTFGVTFTGGSPCFGGALDAPKVTLRNGRATVTLRGAKAASAACVVTLQGERIRPRPIKLLTKALAAGRSSAKLGRLTPGKWRIFYTVRTTALGTTTTSRKKTITVR